DHPADPDRLAVVYAHDGETADLGVAVRGEGMGDDLRTWPRAQDFRAKRGGSLEHRFDRRELLAAVAGDIQRLTERDVVILDHASFVHVIREPVDDAGPPAQQGVWKAMERERAGGAIHGEDLLTPAIALPREFAALRSVRSAERRVGKE